MSRDCKLNRSCLNVFDIIIRCCRRSLPVLGFIPLIFLFIPIAAAFANGGDYVGSFPALDARTGLQYAKAMTVDSAGNIIVVGYMDTGSGDDYQVVKFKADGTGLAAWAPVSYSHGGGGDDVATAVAVDSSDNIIVTGNVWNGINNDIHTIKYNGATGAVIWQHTYNGGGTDTATSIAVDGSGDIYVAGYSVNGAQGDDYLVIKYPSAGATPTWVELYDDSTYPNNNNRILAIVAGSDGIAVTGYSSKGGADFDILTRKYGFDKSLVRSWRYSSAGSKDDRGVAVKMDFSGNVIVTGYVVNVSNNSDIYTVKYSPGSDTPQWSQVYDGNNNDEPKSVWVDGAGDVYVTGYTTTLAGNEDFITIRYSSAGAEIWKSVMDAGNGASDYPVGIVVDNTVDGGAFVTGYSTLSGSEDYLTLKYRKDNGTLLWEKNWSGSSKNDRPVGVALVPAGGANPGSVCVAGWSDSAANGYDFAAIKYDYGALNAPSGLTATAVSNTSITLSWVDNSSNEDRFYIQRKLGESGTFADIDPTVPAVVTGSTYTDSGLVANNYYYYRVRAYNAANGDSYYSNEARALTKAVSYDSPVWKYLYASPGGKQDFATGITVGSDDHPVVTGYSELEEGTSGQYSFDYMTIKIDRANDQTLKWKARYDSGEGGTDMASGVALDSSGNVLVTGTAWLSGGTESSDELYTRKVATAGLNDPAAVPDFLWEDQYGTEAGIDLATAISMAEDGSNNSVVIGYGGNASGNDDIFIVKYANDGSRPWTPIVYNSGRHDHPTSVALDVSGNIFVSGYSFNTDLDPNSYDWFTAKYNGATGALIWSDTYNVSNVNFGGVDRTDLALSIDVDSAGNAYVTGYATNSAGNTVIYTVKYDGSAVPSGNRRIWEKSFNYIGFDAEGVSVKVDPIDGAVVVAGDSYVSATDSDFHLIRYNSADGAVIWDKNFDRPGAEGTKKYEYLSAMTMDSSGYIYLAGNTRSGPDTDAASDDSSDVMSIIYDHEGTFLGAMTYDGAANKQDVAVAIAVNYQGESFVAGFSHNATDEDYLVFKQKNNYILVPAPLGVTPQADYSKVDLTWRENTSGTSFRIERTLGPSNPLSVWSLVTTKSSGTLTHTDTALAAGTNYCYRIDAYSGSLSSRKLEKCVTTTLVAPTLSLLTVDSATQITLNWTQVPDNTGYKIERKTTAGGVWAELAVKAAGENTHVDSGLTPGTIYYYRISTASPAGYSLAGNEQNAVTRPAAPAMAANGAITSTSVVLNWTNVAGETGYKIERKEGLAGAWSQINTRAADVLTYTDNTPPLTPNTQYYYRVRAYNASGDSDYSGEQGALSLFTSPTLSSATASSATQVDLVWTDVSGETGYSIQEASCNYNNNGDNDVSYCTSAYLGSYFSAWTTIGSVGADVLNYQRTGRSSGYAYAYRIIANTTGNSSAGSNAIIAWTHMTAPTLTITPASETSLTPSWTNILAATNYTLERKLGPGGTWAEVTGAIGMAANATSYTNTGLELSTEYCYRVKAYSTLPNNPPAVYSNEPCLFTPLAAPTLEAPTTSATQVDLTWNNVTGNTGYEVQRCQFTQLGTPQNATTYLNNDSYWNTCSTIVTLAADTINYQNTGLTAGYTYRYKVRDTYSGGTSAWSNARAITLIPAAPTLNVPTSPSTTQINHSWGNINGEISYQLEWKVRSGADCSAGTWNGPISIAQNQASYNHTGLSAGTFYCYRLYAANGSGNSGYSAERSQTTLTVPPTLGDPSGVTASQAVLSWSHIAGNTGYKIERKTGSGGTWGTIFTTAADAVTYTNTGLAAGTLYYYRISTNNAAGSSAASAEKSTTTTPLAATVTATTISADRIDLSWPVKSGATNYKIERKEGAGAYSQIDNIAVSYVEKYCGYDYPTVACPSLSPVTTVYQSGGLTENTSYCYQLKSWNSTGGDSGYSVEKCATTSSMPRQNLSASALNSARVRLDWTPVACVPNACDNPDGFEIERQVRYGNWVKVATVDGTTLSFNDTIGIEPNRQYSYRVMTFKGGDRSPYSNTATVTTPLYATSPPSCP